MGLLEPILDLLESEDAIVQCNSCACTMTLAVSGECAVLSLYPLQWIHSILTSYLKITQLICNCFSSHRMPQQILVFPHHKFSLLRFQLRSFTQCFWYSFSYDYKPASDFQPIFMTSLSYLVPTLAFALMMSVLMRLLHFTGLKKPNSFKTPLVSEVLHAFS